MIATVKTIDFLKSTKGFAFTAICIIVLQFSLYLLSGSFNFTAKQSRQDASGFEHRYAKEFFYFYYHLDLFPLATLNTNLTYSKEGAKKEVSQNGEDLLMEYNHWSRLGEHARITAYLPNAWLKGSAKDPSVHLFNTIVFTLSLIIFYLGFWKLKQPIFGLALIALIQLTPFFIYEVHFRENIFAILPSLFLFSTGIILSFRNSSPISLTATNILAGILFAYFSEIRNEVSIIILCFFLLNLLLIKKNLILKVFYCLILFSTFYGGKSILQNHFQEKYAEVKTLVTKANGHVYTGGRIKGHKLWHPIFCGLGDFGEDKGYKWDDRVAYSYAVPILNSEENLNISYSGKYHTDNYYDSDSLYYVKFDEIEVYEEVVKRKVLSDIKTDPLWYLKILVMRVGSILTNTLPFPYAGWLMIPTVILIFKKRKWMIAKIIFASLPLAATSFVIFSARGSTYNAVYAYFIIAFLIFQLPFLRDFLSKSKVDDSSLY